MARPLRIEFDGALYHVTSRGNSREPIFITDTNRVLFLDILKKPANVLTGSVMHIVSWITLSSGNRNTRRKPLGRDETTERCIYTVVQ